MMNNKNINDITNICKTALDDENELSFVHIYSTDQKLRWFGYGEWVEEPDEVNFKHCGLTCKILRVIYREPCEEEKYFGGHLCGYVLTPSGHPWINLTEFYIDCDIHGGITWKKNLSDGTNEDEWIGFDCSHSCDLVPSIRDFQIKFLDSDPLLKNFRAQFPELNYMYAGSYKNIQFVIDETKKLAEQAKEAMNALDKPDL